MKEKERAKKKKKKNKMHWGFVALRMGFVKIGLGTGLWAKFGLGNGIWSPQPTSGPSSSTASKEKTVGQSRVDHAKKQQLPSGTITMKGLKCKKNI